MALWRDAGFEAFQFKGAKWSAVGAPFATTTGFVLGLELSLSEESEPSVGWAELNGETSSLHLWHRGEAVK